MRDRFLHHGIVVSDLEKLESFYTSVLDMERAWKTTLEAAEVKGVLGVDSGLNAAMLEGDDYQIEIMEFNSNSNEDTRPYISPSKIGAAHFAIEVEDLDTIFSEIKEKTEYINKPMVVEGLGGPKVIYIRDPDGNLIELVEMPK
jgi:catechol 2,3-dioxygenase-like lactoylglutathione lyase family enzyme